MYNSKNIEPFFKKVHKEASEAAQKVYDKYNDELKQRVLNQMGKGHTIFSGMGSCSVEGTQNDDHINLFNDFFPLLADNTQYHDKVEAGFDLPSHLTKK